MKKGIFFAAGAVLGLFCIFFTMNNKVAAFDKKDTPLDIGLNAETTLPPGMGGKDEYMPTAGDNSTKIDNAQKQSTQMQVVSPVASAPVVSETGASVPVEETIKSLPAAIQPTGVPVVHTTPAMIQKEEPLYAATGTCGANPQERAYREMDKVNLQIAQVQMEMQLTQLQIQKLQLEVERAKLQDELASHKSADGCSAYAMPTTSLAPVVDEYVLLTIMSFGDKKTAVLRINGRSQEVKEGEKVDLIGEILSIEPESDSILISKNGVERRMYVLGSENKK